VKTSIEKKTLLLIIFIISSLVSIAIYDGTAKDEIGESGLFTVEVIENNILVYESAKSSNPSMINGWRLNDPDSYLVAFESHSDIMLIGWYDTVKEPYIHITDNNSKEKLPSLMETGFGYVICFSSDHHGSDSIFLTTSQNGTNWTQPIEIINSSNVDRSTITSISSLAIEDDLCLLAITTQKNGLSRILVFTNDEDDINKWTKGKVTFSRQDVELNDISLHLSGNGTISMT